MDKAFIYWDDSNTADLWSLRVVATCRPRMTMPRREGGNRIAAISLVLALALAVSSAQAQSDLASEAYKQGDYATALHELQPLAEQGNAAAQTLLGNMYATGRGVPQNDRYAVAWYRKAAEQGFAVAQGSLGFMYANGEGVPQNVAQAMFWYRKAAVQGLAIAQRALGLMYDNGEGVPQNDVQAVAWYRKAAVQGDAPAQTLLGSMYIIGRGVPEDDVQGYAWLNLAAAQGDDKAKEGRDLIRRRMTREQIAEGQKLSREIAARIAGQGEATP